MGVYGCDFETDNDNLGRAWVVQYCITDGIDYFIGRSLEEFISKMLDIMKHEEAYFYFHNLNYDGEFLKYGLYDLKEQGFKIQTFRRGTNLIYFKIEGPEGSKLHKLEIRDSAKKIDGNLKSIGKMIGLPKLEGFEFYSGWSKDVDFNDSKNWDYVKRDAEIVFRAMDTLHMQGYVKATLSGDAWNEVKAMLSTDKNGEMHLNRNFKWDKYFPKLKLSVDLILRKGYFGGINISYNRGFIEGPIVHADVNSMYPTVMTYDKLPYGLPTVVHHEPAKDILYIKHAWFKFKLKEGKLPWLILRNAFDLNKEGLKANEPLIESKEFHDMTFTSVDLETISQNYEITVDESKGVEYFTFKSKVGILAPYIAKYREMKEESEKGTINYLWSKKMQNACYGRFALNPEMETTDIEYVEGILKWISEKEFKEDNDAYLPYAMFITAHARRRLMEYAGQVPLEDIIHADTDSVIHKGETLPTIKYGKKLGEWDIEHRPVQIYEGGFKRYIEILNYPVKSIKDIEMACAGVPQKLNDKDVPVGMWVELLDDPKLITTKSELGHEEYCIKSEWLRKLYIDNGMNPNKVNTYKLIPRNVEGGKILKETTHKLSDNISLRLRW